MVGVWWGPRGAENSVAALPSPKIWFERQKLGKCAKLLKIVLGGRIPWSGGEEAAGPLEYRPGRKHTHTVIYRHTHTHTHMRTCTHAHTQKFVSIFPQDCISTRPLAALVVLHCNYSCCYYWCRVPRGPSKFHQSSWAFEAATFLTLCLLPSPPLPLFQCCCDLCLFLSPPLPLFQFCGATVSRAVSRCLKSIARCLMYLPHHGRII